MGQLLQGLESPAAAPAVGRLRHEIRAVCAMWLRELSRFVSERARVADALGQPLVYLLVMGTGLGATFRSAAVPEGFSYITFIYPGVLGMTVLFTSLFSAISVIWDREFGFLKEILVAPVSRASIVLGKAAGGATVAALQGSLLLLLAPLVSVHLSALQVVSLWLIMLLMAFALTSLGLALASRMSTMEGFQVIMNFLIVPMWPLSGAFFPLPGLPAWMAALVRVDPLTYAVDALRGVIFAGSPLRGVLVVHSYLFNLAVIVGVLLAAFALALATFKSRGMMTAVTGSSGCWCFSGYGWRALTGRNSSG